MSDVQEMIKDLRETVEAMIADSKRLLKFAADLSEENIRLKAAISGALESLEGEPEYHDQGMGCGLEDRGITDCYDAMYHGWEKALERVYGENIAWAKCQLSEALNARDVAK